MSKRFQLTTGTRLSKRRAAFTLLEIFLTLVLSVVLMGLVGAAFQFYVRDMDRADLEVRQTMLAAAIVQMIEDDLRSTIHPEPADLTALEDLMTATLGGQEEVSPGTDLSAAGIEPDELAGSDELLEETTSDLGEGTAVLQRPGLVGNQFQIQIDTSRLPRLEEYTQLLDENTGNLDDIPSDLKTVSYFVQPAESVSGVQDSLAEMNENSNELSNGSGGLVRRTMDRAATTYSLLNSGTVQLDQTGELLAPEVVGIEFQYFDGLTWQIEWNSDEFEELPLAVRIDLSMTDAAALANGADVAEEDSLRVFSHIIRLPMARLIEEEEETDTTDEVTGAAP